MLKSNEALLRVAFYNVGLKRDYQKWQGALAKDVGRLFVRHKLDMVFVCGLGEHEVGLPRQEEYLKEVVCEINDGGAEEPAVRVGLRCGDMATYAVFARQEIIEGASGDLKGACHMSP